MRFLDWMATGLMRLLGMTLIAMVGLSVYNVVARYVFNSALLWADEAAVFGMIVLAWLGAAVCGWRNAEIRMDILIAGLPARVQTLLNGLQQALIAGLCLYVAWQSLAYLQRAHAIGMRSDASGVPVWLIHAVVPLGLVLVALIAMLRCVRLIAGHGARFEPLKPAKVQPE